MATIFLAVGGVGLVLLLLTLLTDGLLDSLDFDLFDNGLFSTVSLATFVAVFGFTGFLSASLGTLPSVLAALGGGLLAGLAIGALVRALKRASQEDGAYSTQALVGATGRVVSPAPPGSYATVALEWQGATNYHSALSSEELSKGQEVRVTGLLGTSAVEVTPYFR